MHTSDKEGNKNAAKRFQLSEDHNRIRAILFEDPAETSKNQPEKPSSPPKKVLC